jgi:hypothetical protein
VLARGSCDTGWSGRASARLNYVVPGSATPRHSARKAAWTPRNCERHRIPQGLKPADQLPYYAERFPVVEVDSTFYTTPPAGLPWTANPESLQQSQQLAPSLSAVNAPKACFLFKVSHTPRAPR